MLENASELKVCTCCGIDVAVCFGLLDIVVAIVVVILEEAVKLLVESVVIVFLVVKSVKVVVSRALVVKYFPLFIKAPLFTLKTSPLTTSCDFLLIK